MLENDPYYIEELKKSHHHDQILKNKIKKKKIEEFKMNKERTNF